MLLIISGSLWWYALHPKYTDLSPYSNKELATELSRRLTSIIDVKEEPGLRWYVTHAVMIKF